MKLDVSTLRYLTKEHFNVLSSIEEGMKDHELVPVVIITRIAKLRNGGVQKIISHLLRNKLIAHDGNNAYEGFRLTYSGYDFLALKYLLKKNIINGLGRQIGVGKESDIYMASKEDGTEVAIKFHRLGRTSFKAVKNKRDYLKNGKTVNWFYMSKLSAMKEFAFMNALYEREFPTPTPICWNRHAICMSLVDGASLYQVRRMFNAEEIYNTAMALIVRLAQIGLVHCDFNEFNLMIDSNEKLYLIDFPQMISTSHVNAEELFNRDVHGLVKYFSRLQGGSYVPDHIPTLGEIDLEEDLRVDIDMEASGFTEDIRHALELEQMNLTKEESVVEDIEAEKESVVQEIEAEKESVVQEIEAEKEPEATIVQANFAPTSMAESYIRQQVKRSMGKKHSKFVKSNRNAAKVSFKGQISHKQVF